MDAIVDRNPGFTRPSQSEAEEAVRTLIRWAGDDPNREGLHETPARVARSYSEFFAGYGLDPEEVLMKTFEETGGYDEMVLIRDIEVESHCEHHMVPINGKAHVAYIPTERIVGISKLARIVDLHARRLQNQERITKDVADDLEKHLGPLGCAVVIEAAHGCMQCRGVMKQNAIMTTSAMRGVFFDKAEARSELMQLIRTREL